MLDLTNPLNQILFLIVMGVLLLWRTGALQHPAARYAATFVVAVAPLVYGLVWLTALIVAGLFAYQFRTPLAAAAQRLAAPWSRDWVAASSAPTVRHALEYASPIQQEGGATGLTAIDRPLRQALQTVEGAGAAIEHTPNNWDAVRVAVAYMRRDCAEAFPRSPVLSFGLPLGWYRQEIVEKQPRVALAWTRLGLGIDNMLVTGMKKSGKDNVVQWMTLCLMEQHSPQELQTVIVDTKGVDWGAFRNKAHTLRHYNGASQLSAAKAFLTDERQRREQLLATYNDQGIRKWSNIPDDKRPPFLWIIITELTLVIQELGKAEAERWLNAELSSWRALGGYVCIVTQTVSKMDTNWRGQIDLFMGGAQPADDADEPNMMLKTAHIKRLGAVPPSELPPVSVAGGVFCLASPSQRSALNLRASFIDDEPLTNTLSQYPNKVSASAAASAAASSVEEPLFAVDLGKLLAEQPGDAPAESPAAPAVDLEDSTPRRPLSWFRERGGKNLSDAEIIEYFLRRLQDEPSMSRSKLTLELWKYNGGSGPNSSMERVGRLWPEVEAQRQATPTTPTR